MAFVNASEDDTGPYRAADLPALLRPDYGPQVPDPQAPYGDGSYDQGYGAPTAAPIQPGRISASARTAERRVPIKAMVWTIQR